VVVVGGTGFVGRHLVDRLAREGVEVIVVGRRVVAELPVGCRFYALDVEVEPERLAEVVCVGARVVNVVDLGSGLPAPEEPEESEEPGAEAAPSDIARRFAAACARAGAARLVQVSTVGVAGIGPRGRCDETAPCRPVNGYQRRKLAVERTLRQEIPPTLDLVVLRPTVVFGEGGRNLEVLAASLAAGPGLVAWARSCLFARRAMHLVPVETVVAAIAWALAEPAPFGGEVFLVSADDAPDNTFRPVERALIAGLGVSDHRLPTIPLPTAVLALLLRVTGRLRMRPDARFSPARLHSRGFVPPIDFGEALGRHARRLGETR
jgi:nucleoside-diphosphate-sugar epimerase